METQDAWTKILLTINIKDIDGLGIDTTGTAVSIWKMAKDNYEITSEMTKINAQEELQTIKYTDDDDFPTHLFIMCSKLSQVHAMGTTISDNTFKVILLNSLPKTWNPAVVPLYNNTSVTNFIWPYLHQFFNDFHGLNGYGKPLKRPFNRYQSRLEAISIG